MHEDDPLQDLIELVLDVEAVMDWRRCCGAQSMPTGGPDLPPPPADLPNVSSRTRPTSDNPPSFTAPKARVRPQRPSPVAPKRNSASAAPKAAPTPSTSSAPVARTLTNAWQQVVQAPKSQSSGEMGLKALTESLGEGARCSFCENPFLPPRGKGTTPILIVNGQPLVPDASKMLAAMMRNVLDLEPSTVTVLHLHPRCRSFFRTEQGDTPRDCGHLFRRQVALIRPQVMLILGREASRALLSPQRIQLGRGRWVDHRTAAGGIPTLMTFHPNFLTMNPEHKRQAFDDLKLFKARMAELGVQ